MADNVKPWPLVAGRPEIDLPAPKFFDRFHALAIDALRNEPAHKEQPNES